MSGNAFLAGFSSGRALLERFVDAVAARRCSLLLLLSPSTGAMPAAGCPCALILASGGGGGGAAGESVVMSMPRALLGPPGPSTVLLLLLPLARPRVT